MNRFVVVTGLSGAGRSVAAGQLEDLGWFVIDNLPSALIPKVGELALSTAGKYDNVALVMGGSDTDFSLQVGALREQLGRVTIVFLEASTEILVRRYETTKRRHPYALDKSLVEAIDYERERLSQARAEADMVVDTSELNPHQLRERFSAEFADGDSGETMRITLLSFGFKHGLPLDVDMVFDCRFLPNPYWDEDLRPFDGRDSQIQDFVLDRDVAQQFLSHITALLDGLLPAFQEEGKSYLTIAFGCTGGHHRSVAVAEALARILKERIWSPRISHRDINR